MTSRASLTWRRRTSASTGSPPSTWRSKCWELMSGGGTQRGMMTTGCSKSWGNGTEMMRPQPSVPRLVPPWRGPLQAGFLPSLGHIAARDPAVLQDFGNPGCPRSWAVPRTPACVRACPFPTPLPALRDLTRPLSPRFGFYKYMKMDEEEEDPRQRAFLFLNADSESPLSAGGFSGISRQLARG